MHALFAAPEGSAEKLRESAGDYGQAEIQADREKGHGALRDGELSG